MPQKLTDESGSLVMDRAPTPFGEVLTGLSSVPAAAPVALPRQSRWFKVSVVQTRR